MTESKPVFELIAGYFYEDNIRDNTPEGIVECICGFLGNDEYPTPNPDDLLSASYVEFEADDTTDSRDKQTEISIEYDKLQMKTVVNRDELAAWAYERLLSRLPAGAQDDKFAQTYLNSMITEECAHFDWYAEHRFHDWMNDALKELGKQQA